MADIKMQYGSVTTLTVTNLNNLGSQAYATSNTIDNTTNLYDDYLVELLIGNTSGGSNTVVVFAVSAVDGTNFSDSQALNLPFQLKFVNSFTVHGTASWRSPAMSVAPAFNGRLPPKFQLVILNDVGNKLPVTGNSIRYLGVKRQIV